MDSNLALKFTRKACFELTESQKLIPIIIIIIRNVNNANMYTSLLSSLTLGSGMSLMNRNMATEIALEAFKGNKEYKMSNFTYSALVVD